MGSVSGSAEAAASSAAADVRTTSPFSTATWRVSQRCLRMVSSAWILMIAITHENTRYAGMKKNDEGRR